MSIGCKSDTMHIFIYFLSFFDGKLVHSFIQDPAGFCWWHEQLTSCLIYSRRWILRQAQSMLSIGYSRAHITDWTGGSLCLVVHWGIVRMAMAFLCWYASTLHTFPTSICFDGTIVDGLKEVWSSDLVATRVLKEVCDPGTKRKIKQQAVVNRDSISTACLNWPNCQYSSWEKREKRFSPLTF